MFTLEKKFLYFRIRANLFTYPLKTVSRLPEKTDFLNENNCQHFVYIEENQFL